MKYFCLICKSPFNESNFKRYCSYDCYLQSNQESTHVIISPCEYCGELVLKYKSHLVGKIFCNRTCSGKASTLNPNFNKKILVPCTKCGIGKKQSDLYSRKTKIPRNSFCSKHCKGTYDSTVPKGIHDPSSSFIRRRSSLELFIEDKVKSYFPYIELILNNRSILLGLELDFYIPDLNLAIEVNGIVHYEAIYGDDLFTKIQEKDNRKIQLCEEKKIDLITVKSTVRFYDSVGEQIWNDEIKPELLKRIPFCENKVYDIDSFPIKSQPSVMINPIKQLYQNSKK